MQELTYERIQQQVDSFLDYQYQQKRQQLRLNKNGQPLCVGYCECEVKQTIGDQCDNYGKESLTEEQQLLLEANVCICGEFDDVLV